MSSAIFFFTFFLSKCISHNFFDVDFYLYFLQADVCHSYQVVHNHGIPDEQIVVMMFDDIADAEE